jgi:hypothetical protein
VDEPKAEATQESPKAKTPKAAGSVMNSLEARLILHPGDRLRAMTAEAERSLAKLVVDAVLKALKR